MHLRDKGEQLAIVSTRSFEKKELSKKIEAVRNKKRVSVLDEISVSNIKQIGKAKSKSRKIAILDIGITNSTIRQLEILGLSITLLPYNTGHKEILRLKPQGLIISGGPEEDPGLEKVADNVRPLINRLPMLGISTGHHVLARALGAKVQKMKFGHRGVNYPIYRAGSYKGEITVQNHSYVPEIDSLKDIKGLKVTGSNLNDHTVEEMESKTQKLIGAQYYPSSPGFDEVNDVFKRFLQMLNKRQYI